MECSAYISCGLAARTHAVEGGVHVLRDLEDVSLLYERVLGRHVHRELGAPRPDGRHPVGGPDLTLEHGVILQQHWGDPQRPVLCKSQNSKVHLVGKLDQYFLILAAPCLYGIIRIRGASATMARGAG